MMVVTDFDGTLLNSNSNISRANIETLKRLGQAECIRVIATGRNFYSFSKCAPSDIPIDYLIFSSGAGVMNWRTKEILQSFNLNISEVIQSFDILIEKGLDFAILHRVPENHKFEYIQRSDSNPDFERRNKLYGDYAKRIDIRDFEPYESCQLIAIDPDDKAIENYNDIKKRLPALKVIRSTSPLDGKTIWIEIYSSKVSKANGSKYIAKLHNNSLDEIMAVGNDYNDLDLLRWADNSYVVDNSPPEIKNEFKVVGANDNDGFSEAINDWISSQ